jgi:insulysin
MNIIKSSNDTRNYKHLVLPNGLKCFIVSDPSNEKAAAVLSVGVGGYSAPTDLPGLAHLLEHMLFFGSETYPEENYYTEYITQNGGDTNAFTSETATTYYFDICSKQFEHALDVFAHFFIDPIFNAEMINREVNAVDSEFYGTFNNDSQRQYQVMNDLMDSEYPVTKFICGNKKTLCSEPDPGTETQSELYQRMMKFYNEHYSSDRMHLVVVGCDTIETLERIVIDKFSSVRYNNCTEGKINPDTLPYDNFLSKYSSNVLTVPVYPYIKVEGLKSKHRLTMTWQLSSILFLSSENKKAITNFWSNILGHEGEKSLCSFLKGKSLISSLSAGTDDDMDKMFVLFQISVILTEHGNINVQTIVQTIDHFIKQLLTVSSQSIERMYNEEKKISWMNFNNKSKESPVSYALNLVDNLCQNCNESMMLATDYYYPEYNTMIESEIRKFICAISNTVPIIVHTSPSHNNLTEMIEKYYGTKYQINSINLDTTIILDGEMDIPEPNIFIPESFAMIEDIKLSGSKQTIYSELGEMWWIPCTEFKIPKLIISVVLLLGSMLQKDTSVKTTSLCKLYTSILRDAINEKLYPATLVGISYSIYYVDGGIELDLRGYSDKLVNVWNTIMKTISNFECDQKRFDQMLEKEKKVYESMNQSDTRSELSHHIDEHYSLNSAYNHMDCLTYLNGLSSVNNIIEFERTLYQSCNYIGAVQGNGTKEMCEKYIHQLDSMLIGKNATKISPYESLVHEPVDRDYETKVFNHVPYNEKEIDVNSSTVSIFNLGTNHMSVDTNILLNQILMMILSDSFFDKLRTKQQLGYYVGCSTDKYQFLNDNHSAIVFTITSSEYDSNYLQNKINEYIDTIEENLTENGFKNCVDSIVVLLSQPFQTLGKTASYNWGKIIDRSYDFLTRERRIEIVKKIQYVDLLQYVRDNISNNHKKFAINVN